MSDDDTLTFVAKIGLTAIAVVKFVVPEPASTLTGAAMIAGIWGVDWSPDDGDSQ